MTWIQTPYQEMKQQPGHENLPTALVKCVSPFLACIKSFLIAWNMEAFMTGEEEATLALLI